MTEAGNETVLVVDDDDRVRSLLRDMLELEGYTVLDTGEADEALRITRVHPGPLHLLLTDLRMPDVEGQVLAERLTALRPEMRTLFVSAQESPPELHAGAAFISKPFTLPELTAKVREVLDSGPPLARPERLEQSA